MFLVWSVKVQLHMESLTGRDDKGRKCRMCRSIELMVELRYLFYSGKDALRREQ